MKSYSIVFTCDNQAGFENRTYGCHFSTDTEAREWANNLLNNPNHFGSFLNWRIKDIFSHSII